MQKYLPADLPHGRLTPVDKLSRSEKPLFGGASSFGKLVTRGALG